MRCGSLAGPAAVVLLAAGAAVAQEPTHMDAATHPGAGQFYWRLLVSRSEYKEAETETKELASLVRLVYGIHPTLAVLAEGEFSSLSTEEGVETGLPGATFRIKYRLFKKDLGPLNSWMASAFAGVTVPGGMERTSDMDAFPRWALVSTAILGRHGVNAELKWEDYGRQPDRMAVNASHLYRVSPVEYAVETRGAWYTMVESLNQFTDDGGSRVDMAAGVLYEARRWAWELSVRWPLRQDGERKDNSKITFGLRFLP